TWLGHPDGAATALEVARSLAVTIPEPTISAYVQGSALANLGVVAQYQGEHAAATAFYREALAIRRRAGDLQGVSRSLADLGQVSAEQCRFEEALAFYREALELPVTHHDPVVTANIIGGVARIAMARDSRDVAD